MTYYQRSGQNSPYHYSYASAQAYDYSQSHDLDNILERLLNIRHTGSRYCRLTLNECIYVANQAMRVFYREPFVNESFSMPCKIVGDLHGQFVDFLRLLSVCGYPPDTSYVFLGDYVDRGPNAIEVLMTLYIYKIKYPERVLLLRGNHECPRINAMYGFMSECTMRFGFSVYTAFNDSFAYMPCAAIIARRIFCCHGGIIKDLETLEQITTFNPRPIHDPEIKSTVTELLWSDPNRSFDGWAENYRGAGYLFGETALTEFLDKFNLDLLARAHEVMQDGYELFYDRKAVTIFSAPNYCNQFDNAAAVMSVSADYTCGFVIIRPISYEFPLTRVDEVGGPGLHQSPPYVAMASENSTYALRGATEANKSSGPETQGKKNEKTSVAAYHAD
ncbi:serine/threonine-protein phosphatase PP1-like [Galendromus occidentalis]|uniref:Serine/threonine-protein phosphatase n=1 Tax=Galendromus occidentalis TaxID=34638 RepID=A0AAJ7L8J3_9ACAR|nr:serine/threonine-protein phosphatase PP1-like [Galendromus occidentalis]